MTAATPTDQASARPHPVVSVVIPAYNKAEHLGLAVESLLGQDYPDLELVVVDDGSTDATSEVLASFEPRVRWVRQPNGGQSAALNRGWSMTSGEFIGYLGADDVLLPYAVSTLVEALAGEPTAVCAYGDYQLIDVRGRVVKEVHAPDFDYRSMVVRLACLPGPGVLFTRSAAARAGWWNCGIRQIPDHDFWLRLGLIGSFVHVPRTLAQFRVHPTSLSFAAPSPALAAEYVRVMEDWFEGGDVPEALRACRGEALSNAYLLETRAHLRGQRYRAAGASLTRALLLHPTNVNIRAARLLAHGVVHHRRRAFRSDSGRAGAATAAGTPARATPDRGAAKRCG